MNFPPPHRGWTSGRATPSLRPNPYAARSTSNPAERHLSKRGNCSDDRSQLSKPSNNFLILRETALSLLSAMQPLGNDLKLATELLFYPTLD